MSRTICSSIREADGGGYIADLETVYTRTEEIFTDFHSLVAALWQRTQAGRPGDMAEVTIRRHDESHDPDDLTTARGG